MSRRSWHTLMWRSNGWVSLRLRSPRSSARSVLPSLTGAIALLLGAAACGGSGGSAANTFTNPVYAHNFPDPFVLVVGKTYYAYATGTCSMDIQGMHSSDLVHWTGDHDVLPKPPSRADQYKSCADFFQNRLYWAPEVLRRTDSTYIMYYVSHDIDNEKQCVSYAVSSSPSGPFVDSSSKPFVCQPLLGGSIDPDIFRDRDGTLYLYWKNDGNSLGIHTYLWGQRLSPNGTRLEGKPVKLLYNDARWEGPLIEAPSMWRNGARYYLFFSANGFNTPSYAVGYADCRGPLGPCKDSPRNPVLTSHCDAVGPGHQALFLDRRGRTWIAYHAWKPGDVGDHPGETGRRLWIDRVTWEGGEPHIHGPTCSAQHVPH